MEIVIRSLVRQWSILKYDGEDSRSFLFRARLRLLNLEGIEVQQQQILVMYYSVCLLKYVIIDANRGQQSYLYQQ